MIDVIVNNNTPKKNIIMHDRTAIMHEDSFIQMIYRSHDFLKALHIVRDYTINKLNRKADRLWATKEN